MKSQYHYSSGEARPFLFCMGMFFAALCFSVIVCSSFFFALNYHSSDNKTAKIIKLNPVERVFTLAVK